MTSDNPSQPPSTESTGTHIAPAEARPDVEYDDFGLPVRKRRPRTPVGDCSDEDEFTDAVAERSKAASQVDIAAKTEDNAEAEKAVKSIVEHVKEREAREAREASASASASASDTAQASVNGQVEMVEVEVGRGDEGTALRETMNTAPESVAPKVTKTGSSEPGSRPEQPSAKLDSQSPAHKKATAPGSSNSAAPEARKSLDKPATHHQKQGPVNEYSHQHAVAQPNANEEDEREDDDGGWQTMPAYAQYDMYDDDNRLIAKENPEELEDMHGYANVGGAAKGYTRVILDDDADSQTSMDDNTAYLFKEKTTALHDEDEAVRDPLMQMQATKNLLTEGQRVAYVGLVRLAMIEMERKFNRVAVKKSRQVKKALDMQTETTKMWSQKMMVRLYGHMDINTSEQVMIEQLTAHGVIPADLTPALMQNARVKNPAAEVAEENKEEKREADSACPSVTSPRPEAQDEMSKSASSASLHDSLASPPPPPYEAHEDDGDEYPEPKTPSQLFESKNLDIDLRWTVLCDLFLLLVADSIYDSRSRELFQVVGKYLSVDWLEICRFEKRVTDALEMQEEANKENWNEDEHMESRRKKALRKRLAFMGLATVGGGLVIGLSAGLLAPVIGAGLAAGFTTIGVAGTGSFLAGAGGTAVITSIAVTTGGTVGVRAMNRRTGAVKTFEYRPLHNNKRTNLIITLAGWMSGKADDVRLPYSTVDPVMGDIYSVLWEPEMLRSMGDTINILATEALTQGLQQVLGSTLLTALMSAMTLPLALTKLSYLIDNPWSVSQARADMAGLILADSIIDRNLGTRPITLVGFSLGARVIYAALRELQNRGAFGLVQNVYMFGTPIVANTDEYIKIRSVVPGRFVNGYATNDWILGYLFRATGGGAARVAGLAPIQISTIENMNVTELVPGHMAYRAAMPKLLRDAGWLVESDEFTEIEDPDPENHEQRQRELIDEIEEARRELEKKNAEKEKKGGKLSWWRKKKGDKKDWEVYDKNSQTHTPIDKTADTATIAENPVMFDIDAIRREVAALAVESAADKPYNGYEPDAFEIKEIKSTLPPMKIDISATTPTSTGPYTGLRQTQSFNDSLGVAAANGKANSTGNLTPGVRLPPGSQLSNGTSGTKEYDEYDEFDDPGAGNISMTFDSSFRDPPSSKSTTQPSPSYAPEKSAWDSPPLAASSMSWEDATNDAPGRPPLRSANTMPPSNSGYNAWADEFEDDFGQEKEVKMSFM
ncbi:DUF726-domain-containing protein [Macroventuria anomochaeta]|uniref:DUF726-domain-containing protein n=1 Tax=Macroventuria anomochaeta TaxID=301207 RepID=A0ACB6RYE8_9PLEO|nr:DUF726-domain-containing protein [Macroventuria anomochaeta]KAF2626896.1 DUF726-domain-containing protein [Macroventuria anomochaeta]